MTRDMPLRHTINTLYPHPPVPVHRAMILSALLVLAQTQVPARVLAQTQVPARVLTCVPVQVQVAVQAVLVLVQEQGQGQEQVAVTVTATAPTTCWQLLTTPNNHQTTSFLVATS